MRIHLSLGVERNNQEEINPIDDRESEVRSASSQTTEVLTSIRVRSHYLSVARHSLRCTGLNKLNGAEDSCHGPTATRRDVDPDQ
jgi:hypothetical protein